MGKHTIDPQISAEHLAGRGPLRNRIKRGQFTD